MFALSNNLTLVAIIFALQTLATQNQLFGTPSHNNIMYLPKYKTRIFFPNSSFEKWGIVIIMHKFKHISHRYFPDKTVKREVQGTSHIWVNAVCAIRKRSHCYMIILPQHPLCNRYTTAQLTNSD
jgi:hypothetical protein